MQGDAYSEIVDMIRVAQTAPFGMGPVHLRRGEVLGLDPLKIDVAGTPQEAERFFISHRLLKGHRETLNLECTEVSARFSLTASCPCPDGGHSGSSAAAEGGTLTAKAVAAVAEPVLKEGDIVLLLTEDDQIFYLIDKVVRAA